MCSCEVAPHPGNLTESRQGICDALLIPQCPAQRQALFAQRLCPHKVALSQSQACSRCERLHPHRCCNSLTSGQCPLQEDASLSGMTMCKPEAPESSAQAQGHLCAPGLCAFSLD